MATSRLNMRALRELASLKPELHSALVEFRREKRTRRIFYKALPIHSQIYLAEGATYRFFAPNGNQLAADMVSEATMGAAGGVGGINYAVGQRTPRLPEGTWVLETELFLGAWMAHVYYVGPNRLDVEPDDFDKEEA